MPIPMIVQARLVAATATLACTAAIASAQIIAITGGTVYPVSGPKIENGTVLIRDGKIIAVGATVAIPADAQRVDARGKWVTPGFINGATTLGLSEAGGPEFSGGYNDTRAKGEAGIAASFDAWRGINPRNTFIIPARQEGVTSVVVAPQGGMIAGRAAVVDLLDAQSPSEMLRANGVAMTGSFGAPDGAVANARGEYWTKWASLIADVKAYADNRRAYDSARTRAFITSREQLEALIPVARGRLPLLVSVDRATDILAAIDFAKTSGVRLWIEGGAEAWMVAKELAAAKIPVFTGAMNDIPTDFATLGQRQENASLLHAAGVSVVLIGNGPGDPSAFNVRNIRQEAGNAVAYGMSWEAALRAITLTPAEVMGLDGSVGSLQPGRDANVVVWSGDPFEFASVAEQVFVRGKTSMAKSRQQQLTERYLSLPPAYYRP
ncbi:MAG: amidohydrolase family protein [Gemmatimonadota bacterium]